MTSPHPLDGGLADLDPQLAADLVATAGDLAVVLDRQGIVRQVVTTDAELQASSLEEWIGRPWIETVTPETRSKIETLLREAGARTARRRQVNQVLATGHELPVSYTMLRVGRDGTLIAAGRDMRSVSALQQRLVEAQQAMERDYWRLRHVETRYRLLFQLAADAFLVVDGATSKVVDANAAAARLFADAPEKLIGRTFPFGIAPDDVRAVSDALANARAVGRSTELRAQLARGGEGVTISASTFRQESNTLLLVRLAHVDAAAPVRADTARVAAIIDDFPDPFAITDAGGVVRYANRAFLDLCQVTSDDEVRGEEIGTWIGRPGADFAIFENMLRRHGAVRLAQTAARGAHGLTTEVEVSAAWLPDAKPAAIGFLLRDVGRRLASGPQGARDLTRAVEQLTALVGRVSLRELVRDTIDLVERHFIEAALELTDDNRTSAAEVLGVSRQSLYVKLRRHRLLEGPDSGMPNLE